MNLIINQTDRNKYKINGKGHNLTGRKMWANVTNELGTPIEAKLVKLDGSEHDIFFSAVSWGRKDGKKIQQA